MPVHREDDFVVVGFSAPRGSRTALGALQLARWHDGAWTYAGAVGTGAWIVRQFALDAEESEVVIRRADGIDHDLSVDHVLDRQSGIACC